MVDGRLEKRAGSGKQEDDCRKRAGRIESGLSPNHWLNAEAAERMGLQYDSSSKVYRDSDGCPARDQYGQRLG